MEKDEARRDRRHTLRQKFLSHALQVAKRDGLEHVSFGRIARELNTGKTSVFSCFGSRAALQIGVLNMYEKEFHDSVIAPSLGAQPGLPRLVLMFNGWVTRILADPGLSCLYLSLTSEYANRKSPISSELIKMTFLWRSILETNVKKSLETGALPASANAEQVVYEIYSVIHSLHHNRRLLGASGEGRRARIAFDRLMEQASH